MVAREVVCVCSMYNSMYRESEGAWSKVLIGSSRCRNRYYLLTFRTEFSSSELEQQEGDLSHRRVMDISWTHYERGLLLRLLRLCEKRSAIIPVSIQ